MSIQRMTAAWQHSKHSGTELLQLLALADSADDSGFAYPGIDTLASKTRSDRSMVLRNNKALAASGEVLVQHNRRYGNKYLVVVGMSDADVEASLLRHFPYLSADNISLIMRLRAEGKGRIPSRSKVANGDFISGNLPLMTKSQPATSEVAPVPLEKSQPATSEVAQVPLDPSKKHQEESSEEPIPPAPPTADASAPDGAQPERPALHEVVIQGQSGPIVVSGLTVQETLAVLEGEPREVWLAARHAEQHQRPTRYSPRSTLLTALDSELDPVPKVQPDDYELAVIIAECSFAWDADAPLVDGNIKGASFSLVKAIRKDLDRSMPTPDELRAAYASYAAAGLSSPRSGLKLITMVNEYRKKGHSNGAGQDDFAAGSRGDVGTGRPDASELRPYPTDRSELYV
ncbi:MAG: hypothetical protein JW910_03820 [Anaerolineae bacterium]|nr:hypothetical protein [Anaerolineae bacterium]